MQTQAVRRIRPSDKLLPKYESAKIRPAATRFHKILQYSFWSMEENGAQQIQQQ